MLPEIILKLLNNGAELGIPTRESWYVAIHDEATLIKQVGNQGHLLRRKRVEHLQTPSIDCG